MAEEPGGLVLLDVMPGADGEFDRSMMERFGHPVTVCNGPGVQSLCPLLGGQGCEHFSRAHGVVFALDLDRPQHRAIVRNYRELGRPDLPIRVVCSPEQSQRYAGFLDAVEVWDHEPTVADLDGFAAEVEAADRLA